MVNMNYIDSYLPLISKWAKLFINRLFGLLFSREADCFSHGECLD